MLSYKNKNIKKEQNLKFSEKFTFGVVANIALATTSQIHEKLVHSTYF